MGRVGGHSFKSLLHCGSISLCFSADCCSVWNPLRRENRHVRFCLDELIKRKKCFKWIDEDFWMVDQWHQRRKHVGPSDSTSEDRPKQIPLLEELLLSDKSHLRLNGVTHRLAAAWFGFAKLHFESKVKKKKGFWRAVTVVIIRNVIWHQRWVNCHILHLLFPQ